MGASDFRIRTNWSLFDNSHKVAEKPQTCAVVPARVYYCKAVKPVDILLPGDIQKPGVFFL